MALLHRFRSLPGGVAPKSDRLTFWHSLTLSCVLIAVSACAWAQEAKPKFSVYNSQGAYFGDYATQIQAEAAIKSIPGPVGAEDIYQYVDTIKEAHVSESGEMAVTYWMGAEKAKDEDWAYDTLDVTGLPTENAAIEEILRQVNARAPQCGAVATLTPTGDWIASTGPYPEYDRGMEHQVRVYRVDAPYDNCEGTYAFSSSVLKEGGPNALKNIQIGS